MSDLQKSLQKKLPPVIPPTQGAGGRRGSGSGGRRRKHEYTPVSWDKYWEKCEDIEVREGDIFRVYRKGTSGPLLFLLHGGGYSALTWSLFAECVTSMVECQVLAFDQRGHGDSYTTDDLDLSADTLAKDVERVMEAVFEGNSPPCVLIGHSMGGAIGVHTAYNQYIPGLVGLVVIDVVEGTAMDALSSMQSFLRGRPQHFNSLQNAVEWSVRSGQTRNSDAARVSMPGQVKNVETGKCGTMDLDAEEAAREVSDLALAAGSQDGECVLRAANSIPEESEDIEGQMNENNFKPPLPINKYTWRIDLSSTEQFWPGWFQGLSSKFLASGPAKMLVLAGVDRLDTDLTVGQMQGKFQMQVLPQCGHAVHEDVPDRVAEVLATFLLRHRLSTPIGDFHSETPEMAALTLPRGLTCAKEPVGCAVRTSVPGRVTQDGALGHWRGTRLIVTLL